MTLVQERKQTEITRVPSATRRFTEWTMGIVGVVAAAVGAYMFYAPASWAFAGLAESWYFGFFVGAGALLAAAFGILARRVYLPDRRWSTRAVFGTALSVLALAGAVVFAVIWIL